MDCQCPTPPCKLAGMKMNSSPGFGTPTSSNPVAARESPPAGWGRLIPTPRLEPWPSAIGYWLFANGAANGPRALVQLKFGDWILTILNPIPAPVGIQAGGHRPGEGQYVPPPVSSPTSAPCIPAAVHPEGVGGRDGALGRPRRRAKRQAAERTAPGAGLSSSQTRTCPASPTTSGFTVPAAPLPFGFALRCWPSALGLCFPISAFRFGPLEAPLKPFEPI